MDKLYIQGLRLNTLIGCLNWEQQMPQTVIVDIEMAVDCKKISLSDSILDTPNYAQMSDELITFAGQQNCHLIETLAEKIAQFIHQQYPTIKQLKLTLEKPGAILRAQTVGVVIERDYA